MKKKLVWPFLIFLLLSPAIPANAYEFTGAKLRSPTTIDYYIASSVGEWTTDAIHGVMAWDPGAEIKVIGRTYTKSDATIRFEKSRTDTNDFATQVSECECVYSDYSNITFWADFGPLGDSLEKENCCA
ncbi:hypothetical protein [Cytobacillus firmus]|uniref:hypothetical protein n=1 Tax=Cytobacillus firmus TaxID=1399 RepID=UPI001C8E628A|nr:hypothetical protein [Cytobacillus firmus]MBX9976366.1 hypothetical protein [Cytobacillus firmus]